MSNKKKTKVKVKVNPDGSMTFTLPFVKPRNPNIPKGTQRHKDKRKQDKHKGKVVEYEWNQV